MPQKKNPDAAELIRGKTGRVYGDLTAVLTLMKGLPLTYNRDLQEDKEPLFDAADTLQLCLGVMAAMVPIVHVREERLDEIVREGFMEATDLADALVAKGMPFREAHGVIGKLVLYCIDKEKPLTGLTLEEARRFSPLFDKAILAQLTPKSICAKRNIPGGTAPKQVAAAIKRARRRIQQ
jgi:argininosuccinate lyase